MADAKKKPRAPMTIWIAGFIETEDGHEKISSSPVKLVRTKEGFEYTCPDRPWLKIKFIKDQDGDALVYFGFFDRLQHANNPVIYVSDKNVSSSAMVLITDRHAESAAFCCGIETFENHLQRILHLRGWANGNSSTSISMFRNVPKLIKDDEDDYDDMDIPF